MSIVGDIITNIVHGQVKKAVDGFVGKGMITPAQGAVLVEGIMLEVQLGLEMWQQSQAKKA